MRLQVAKWGNSLAVRLPVDYLRAAGLKEGDELEAQMTAMGEIRLSPMQHFDKVAFLERVAQLRAALPMTATSVAAMRQEERY